MMKKYAMGIDIGGTNTAFGLVDEDGNIIAESKISTEKFRYFDDYKPYVETLVAAMKELIAHQPECELIGIGVGAPNANIHTGRIETPANLWKFEDPTDPRPNSIRTFNFVDDLAKHFGGAKVMITNDAHAAAIEGLCDDYPRHRPRLWHSLQWRDGLWSRWLCRRIWSYCSSITRDWSPVWLRSQGLP